MSTSSVEKLEGLKRKLKITVPAEALEQEYVKRLDKIAKSAKIDGFRPGKVPANVLEKRFGQNILTEVIQELLNKFLVDAVQEHDLKVAGTPEITPGEVSRNKPFEFTVQLEVYPEVALADMSAEKLERLQVNVEEKDIDNMLQVIRKQQSDWDEVEREATQGDRVIVDFKGYIGGELFEHGAANDFKLELGSKQMIPGFEEGIVGAKIGEEREIKCTFPENYGSDALAGKEATFKINVKKVLAPKLPEVTDEFAKEIGFEGGVAELKQDIERNMLRQIEQVMQDKVKRVVMEKLLALNAIEIPDALIQAEIDHLIKVAKQQNQNEESADLPRDEFAEQARRRVTLGLLLSEVIKKHDLKVDPQKVRERVELIASVYHEPEKVIQWYYGNNRLLGEIESVVLEDQAVEKLVLEMQVEVKTVNYEEATQYAKKATLESEEN